MTWAKRRHWGLTVREGWEEDAACSGHQADGCPCEDGVSPCGAWRVFDWADDVLGRNARAESMIVREAIRVCRSCPVVLDCLGAAWDSGLEGIRGGMTFAERLNHGALRPEHWRNRGRKAEQADPGGPEVEAEPASAPAAPARDDEAA